MSENVGYLRFVREVNTFSRRAAYAFIGNESFFKADALETLRAVWLKQNSLDEERFDGEEKTTKINKIEEAIGEYPLIGKYRLVVIKNADKVKDLKKVGLWLKELPPDCKILCVFSDEIKEIPTKELDFSTVIVCNDMGVESKEFDKYIDYCLEPRRKSIDEEGRKYLKSVFGNTPHLMRMELLKTSYFVGGTVTITRRDLELCLANYPASKVFDLVDHVIRRDMTQALTILNDLMEQGTEGSLLIHLITQRVQALEGAIKATSKGEKLKDYMQRRRIPLFQYGQLFDGLKTIKEYHVQRFYDELCAADFRLKSWVDSRLTMEGLVITLCC